MDLYAIHKLYQSGGDQYGTGTITSGTTSGKPDKSLWDSHFADPDEFARFLNMMLAKSPLMDGPAMRAYDVSFDDSSSEDPSTTPVGFKRTRVSSTDFVSSLLSPFSQGSGRITSSYNSSGVPSPGGSVNSKLPTLADQFTWGAVVCAGVFIVVFVCVMAAWWVHKKQQERVRSRRARPESRRPPGPYCIDSDPRLAAGRSESQSAGSGTVQRPPSYFEVIGFFDPPPSYSDVLRVGRRNSQHQTDPPPSGYDNVAITIDELPPPFAEDDYAIKSSHEENLQHGSCSAMTTNDDANAAAANGPETVIIPIANESNTMMTREQATVD